jgi:hypothetical protein
LPACLRRVVAPLTLAVAVGAGVVPVLAPAAPASAASVTTVYMAPLTKGGSDRHTGLGPSSAVSSLARVEQVLAQRKPVGDVVVRIKQGTYVQAQTTWKFYVPGHTISFMPANYVPGHGRPAGGDPVFLDASQHGRHVAGWWFQALEPTNPTGALHDGGNAGLRFYYLTVEDYTNAISFDGQTGHNSQVMDARLPLYTKPSAGLNNNEVSGMTFYDIGDTFAPGQTGYGAILLTDSSGNDITNNTFDTVENSGSTAGLIHGIYVTHFSDYNSISLNKFETINSYAVKVRDRSNFNNVTRNRFYSISYAAFEDQYCDTACADEDPGTPRQCASYGNRFTDNLIASGAAYSMDPAGETNAGGSPCSIPRGEQRLYVGGNT